MTDNERREFFEQTMAEHSPKLQHLRSELARVSELVDQTRANDTPAPLPGRDGTAGTRVHGDNVSGAPRAPG
jgi:hypothetical protein